MSDQTAPLGLHAKLLEVAKSIDYFEKHGRNDHHRYNYVQATDVVRDVRKQLFDRGIIVLPSAPAPGFAAGVTNLPFGDPSKGKILTTVEVAYTFVDTETGERETLNWFGAGADTGGDKGLYKAYTGGLKYLLQQLVLAPMSDDPERDNLTEHDRPKSQDKGQGWHAVHKDDLRPAAPLIPADRATDMFRRAKALDYVTYDLEASPGTPPKFHLALKSALGLRGVQKIGELNVDQAESFEAWLTEEEAKQAAEQEVQA